MSRIWPPKKLSKLTKMLIETPLFPVALLHNYKKCEFLLRTWPLVAPLLPIWPQSCHPQDTNGHPITNRHPHIYQLVDIRMFTNTIIHHIHAWSDSFNEYFPISCLDLAQFLQVTNPKPTILFAGRNWQT